MPRVRTKFEGNTRSPGPEQPARDGRPSSFATALPVSRSEHVADVVRAAILSGALVAGDQLKQDELRAELGVSPTPIREGLRQLESEGLVTHYPNRGVFVSSVSPKELFGVLLPVRLTLERYAVMQALPDLGDKVFRQLEQLVDDMQQGAARDDRSTVHEADMAFHELLVARSGAPHTIQLWRAVQPRIRVVLYQLGPRHRSLAEIPAEHLELLEALRRGDPDEIGNALESHIVGDPRRLIPKVEGNDKIGAAKSPPERTRRTTRTRKPSSG